MRVLELTNMRKYPRHLVAVLHGPFTRHIYGWHSTKHVLYKLTLGRCLYQSRGARYMDILGMEVVKKVSRTKLEHIELLESTEPFPFLSVMRKTEGGQYYVNKHDIKNWAIAVDVYCLHSREDEQVGQMWKPHTVTLLTPRSVQPVCGSMVCVYEHRIYMNGRQWEDYIAANRDWFMHELERELDEGYKLHHVYGWSIIPHYRPRQNVVGDLVIRNGEEMKSVRRADVPEPSRYEV